MDLKNNYPAGGGATSLTWTVTGSSALFICGFNGEEAGREEGGARGADLGSTESRFTEPRLASPRRCA